MRVVDSENDKVSKMTKEEQEKYLEDQRQTGKVSNEIVEIFVKQKCTGCDRFCCKDCLDECSNC